MSCLKNINIYQCGINQYGRGTNLDFEDTAGNKTSEILALMEFGYHSLSPVCVQGRKPVNRKVTTFIYKVNSVKCHPEN